MSQKKPNLQDCPHVFVVEGYSDLYFYLAVLDHLQRAKGVFFQIFEGKSRIQDREVLGTFINEKLLAEKQSIGILVDADDNAAGTAHSIRDRLKEITGREVDEGQWHELDGAARLGFFVAPDSRTEGEVETLAWTAFPDVEPHLSMKQAVKAFHEKMASLGWQSRSPNKGRIGAYLAAAYDEDPCLGPAALKKKFAFDAPGFARLRAFFEVLPRSP